LLRERLARQRAKSAGGCPPKRRSSARWTGGKTGFSAD